MPAISSSFRDPAGFLFTHDGVLLRQVNQCYKENYDHLLSSGLFEKLVQNRILVPHKESSHPPANEAIAYKIIEPEKIPFISYPYEWCFGQLKDAALLTLEIQKLALEHDMSLKDASAYNIQFFKGKPIFIDTLSFERYQEGKPWQAYRQFCQHFLAPLSLMHYTHLSTGKLSTLWVDGIPLDIAASFLPFWSRLSPSIFLHIHLHAKSQAQYGNTSIASKKLAISRTQLLAIIDNLENCIQRLHLPKQFTEWGDYYNNTNYNQTSFEQKKHIISEYLKESAPHMVWDLGGNDGTFSRLASNESIFTVCFDIDPIAVNKNYQAVKTKNEKNILPLIFDLTNPSPNIGWASKERDNLAKRGPADTILALAIIHHLAISNNLPFAHIANYFSKLGKYLIIEFVPKEDSNTQKLLRNRVDIFDQYSQEHFEHAFGKFFHIQRKNPISNSIRTMYLMKNHNEKSTR